MVGIFRTAMSYVRIFSSRSTGLVKSVLSLIVSSSASLPYCCCCSFGPLLLLPTAFALAILNPSLWFWQDPEDCGMVTVAHFMVLMVVSPTSIAKSTNIPSSESMALEIRRSPWTESSGAKYLPNRRGGPLRCPVARLQ